MKPSVSVVIPAYDTVHLLPRSIESALAQTHPATEIIVVDDASPNPALPFVRPYLDKVRLLRREKNGGLSAARNDGIRAAQGEWIGFLDHDDLWLPEKTARQLKVADDYPEAALIYSDALQRNYDGEMLPNYHADKHPLSGHILDGLIDNFFVLAGASMVKKEALLAVNGFDDNLPGSEDQDLFLRLSLRGYEIRLAPEPLIIYERQPNSMSRNHIKMLQCQSVMWTKLLVAGLTPEQVGRVRRKLADTHFDLSYRLRGKDWSASVRHARTALKHAPLQLSAWKLLAANTVLSLANRTRAVSKTA